MTLRDELEDAVRAYIASASYDPSNPARWPPSDDFGCKACHQYECKPSCAWQEICRVIAEIDRTEK